MNMSLKFVPKRQINNIPALVQIMAWRRQGDKPLSEPMLARLPMHICVTQPQWVKHFPNYNTRQWLSLQYGIIINWNEWIRTDGDLQKRQQKNYDNMDKSTYIQQLRSLKQLHFQIKHHPTQHYCENDIIFHVIGNIGCLWWYINISSGNRVLPSGIKPLSEPTLTQIYVTVVLH